MVLPCWKILVWAPRTVQLVCTLRTLCALLDPVFVDTGLLLKLRSS